MAPYTYIETITGSGRFKASVTEGMSPPALRKAGVHRMPRYRIYLRNADEQIVSHADTDCASDSEACVLAESLLQPGQQAEIWQGLRRVRLVSLYTASDRNRLIN